MDLLKSSLKNHKKLTIACLVLLTLSMAYETLQPLFFKQIVVALVNKYNSSLVYIGVTLISLAIFSFVTGILFIFATSKLSKNISIELRVGLFKKIQTFSYEQVTRFSIPNLVMRQTVDVNDIQRIILGSMRALYLPFLLLGSVIFAIYTIPRLWWIVFCLIFSIALVMFFSLKNIASLITHFKKKEDEMNAITQEDLKGIRLVKSFVQTKLQIALYKGLVRIHQGYSMRFQNTFAILVPAFNGFLYFFIIFTIFLFAKTETQVENSGNISAFITYLVQIAVAVIEISFTLMGLTQLKINIDRINEILVEPSEAIKNTLTPITQKGELSFDHVSYYYGNSSENTALNDISFSIEAGEKIGIIGASGSGKSSIFALMVGLLKPKAGTIHLGEHNIASLSAKTIAQEIHLVFQRPILFSGTIAYNLKLGNPKIDDYAMTQACELVLANAFIHDKPMGFNTHIDERGTNFSGGQKQRLCLARAILANTPIIILDDSMSALDAESEAFVQDALRHKLPGKTIIQIAQKVSSIQHSDRIIVLDKGKITGIGSHDELLKTCPTYQEIAHSQEGGIYEV